MRGVELEKMRTKIAESSDKISEMERTVVSTRTALDRSKKVQKHLMSTGVREVVDKIFASHEFEYLMGNLVLKIQTTGTFNYSKR